jgi:hypothetical protein
MLRRLGPVLAWQPTRAKSWSLRSLLLRQVCRRVGSGKHKSNSSSSRDGCIPRRFIPYNRTDESYIVVATRRAVPPARLALGLEVPKSRLVLVLARTWVQRLAVLLRARVQRLAEVARAPQPHRAPLRRRQSPQGEFSRSRPVTSANERLRSASTILPPAAGLALLVSVALSMLM